MKMKRTDNNKNTLGNLYGAKFQIFESRSDRHNDYTIEVMKKSNKTSYWPVETAAEFADKGN